MNSIIPTLFLSAISPHLDQDIHQFNLERIDLTQSGMIVLGTWALLNILLSPILAIKSTGAAKDFHQMNALWNIVNLALAIYGYYTADNNDASLSLVETIIEQTTIEKILLFNAGLDLAYIATGFYLKERSKNNTKHQNRLLGFGNSLILQGAWLFVFDLGFYLFQNKHAESLFHLMN